MTTAVAKVRPRKEMLFAFSCGWRGGRRKGKRRGKERGALRVESSRSRRIQYTGIPRYSNNTPFLDASSHLYKRVCPSVRPSVGPSVRRSVRRSVTPSLRRLRDASNAEYSALFSFLPEFPQHFSLLRFFLG